MKPNEYKTLHEFEDWYWWFVVLHKIITDTFTQLKINKNARVLDAGCGTGGLITQLNAHSYKRTIGFDISQYSSVYWKKRKLLKNCIASINEIPFANNTFDVITSVDVFESAEVNESVALFELMRVLKKGGFVLLIFPAFDFLFSDKHHKATNAVRRYSKKKIKSLIDNEKINIVRITNIFSLVFPFIVIYRKLLANLYKDEKSELRHIPDILNKFMQFIMKIEIVLLKIFNLPFGSSFFVILQK